MHCALRRAMHAGRRALSTARGGAVVAKLGAGRGLRCSGRGRRARGRGRAAAAVRRGVGGARRPRLIQRGAALRPVEARRRAARGQRRREEQCLFKSTRVKRSARRRADALKHHRLWSKPDGSEVACVATFGTDCVGHPGVVHGGVTSLLFDNTLGWANALSITKGGDPSQHDTVKQFGMTANLSVNYRRPLFVGQTVVISCSLDKVEGRKRFLKGVMKDGKTGGVIADATALYVSPRTAAEKAAGVKSTWAKWWRLRSKTRFFAMMARGDGVFASVVRH